jgi:hypothetical protein
MRVSEETMESTKDGNCAAGPARICRLVSFDGGFSDKDEATVGVSYVEFGHAVFAVEQIANPVLTLEGLYVLPQGVDSGYFDVDLGVLPHAFHYFVGCCFHEMDGLSVALEDRIVGRFSSGRESEDILKEQNGFLHIVGREHGADSFRRDCTGRCRHEEASASGDWFSGRP